jgi:N-acetylglutamate synthase/N-acetylornithine aminotransferase
MYHGKIYCANCRHCKLLTSTALGSSVIPLSVDGEDQNVPRIRCAAGKWKKKLGQEKLYKYSTIIRRYLDYCDAYEAMGDAREFIRELRKTISDKDAF